MTLEEERIWPRSSPARKTSQEETGQCCGNELLVEVLKPDWIFEAKRYEEAMNELDAFIDQALLNNMAQVDIIHAVSEQVLSVKVSPNTYKRNKHVKSFGYTPQNAGGSGCDYCDL